MCAPRERDRTGSHRCRNRRAFRAEARRGRVSGSGCPIPAAAGSLGLEPHSAPHTTRSSTPLTRERNSAYRRWLSGEPWAPRSYPFPRQRTPAWRVVTPTQYFGGLRVGLAVCGLAKTGRTTRVGTEVRPHVRTPDGTLRGISPRCCVNRRDRTPLERFLAGIRSSDAGLWRHFQVNKSSCVL
jgi:hypothetical protein